MKKFLSLFMSIVTIFLTISCSTVVASAKTYNIKDFSANTNLSGTQYGIIREGSFVAYTKNGEWFYKFTKNKDSVIISISAFTKSTGNNLSAVNSALTEGVSRKDSVSTSYAYAYKTRSTSKHNNPSFKVYNTNISWLDFSSIRDGKNIELECISKSNVDFVYSEKIAVYYKNVKQLGKTKKVKCKAGDIGSWLEYKKPSTAEEYKAALKRTTSYTRTVTPTFSIQIANPGTNCVYLSTARYEAKGLQNCANTKTALTDFVDVGYTTAKIAAKTVKTGSLTFASLYTIGEKGIKLAIKFSDQKKEKNKSIDFIDTSTMKLSNDNKKTGKVFRSLYADFESPIKLKNYGDLFRVKVKLTNSPSTSKTKTVINVSVKNIKIK